MLKISQMLSEFENNKCVKLEREDCGFFPFLKVKFYNINFAFRRKKKKENLQSPYSNE